MPSVPRLSASGPAAVRWAAAALLAVLLAGCKITLAAPAATSAPGSPGSAPARSGSLITEPGAGFWPVYRLIKHARHSIDVTMFEFADTKAEHDLAAAARRGVRVRVVLDQREKSTNTGAYQYLVHTGSRSSGLRPPTPTPTRRPWSSTGPRPSS
jgi:phosphatidylserine/phosphatidylglycerophosphate/cardiolipin synthase-like enzyme